MTFEEVIESLCVINHIEFDASDPEATVEALIKVEVEMALDPAISERAQTLIDYGKRQAGAAAKVDEAITQVTHTVDNLRPEDIKIDTYAHAGCAGWSFEVHRGVRIIHLPSGLQVSCETERSQHANKKRCLELLVLSLLGHAIQGPEDSAINCKDTPNV